MLSRGLVPFHLRLSLPRLEKKGRGRFVSLVGAVIPQGSAEPIFPPAALIKLSRARTVNSSECLGGGNLLI